MTMIVCNECGELKEYRAKGMCHNCYHKKWRNENKEKSRHACKKWRSKNRDYHKKHYEENIEHYKELRRNWWEKNKDKFRESRKEYQEEHKDIFREYLDQRRIDRLIEICESYGLSLKCMFDGCTISDPILLSVRHVNGRLPEEYSKNKYHRRRSYRTQQKTIISVPESIFQEHIKNKNYMLFCMNHGQVYEWGTINERLSRNSRYTKARIKNKTHRLSLLGGNCSICDESDYNYLCAHHIDSNGKNDVNLARMTEKRFQELYHANELQCSCLNCHTLLHFNLGSAVE